MLDQYFPTQTNTEIFITKKIMILASNCFLAFKFPAYFTIKKHLISKARVIKYNMAAFTDGGIILAATTKPSPVMFTDSLKNLNN